MKKLHQIALIQSNLSNSETIGSFCPVSFTEAQETHENPCAVTSYPDFHKVILRSFAILSREVKDRVWDFLISGNAES